MSFDREQRGVVRGIWIGYKGGAAGRAFGFACTFYPTAGAYLLAIVLLIAR